MHKQGVRIQRLALADVSAGTVIIGKTVKQVTMPDRPVTSAVTRQLC